MGWKMAVRNPVDCLLRSPGWFTRMQGYVSVRKNSASVFKNSSICSYVFKMLRGKEKKSKCKHKNQTLWEIDHLHSTGNKDTQVTKQRAGRIGKQQGESQLMFAMRTFSQLDVTSKGWCMKMCAWASVYEKWCWSKEKPMREGTGI